MFVFALVYHQINNFDDERVELVKVVVSDWVKPTRLIRLVLVQAFLYQGEKGSLL